MDCCLNVGFIALNFTKYIVYPRRMREGYGSRSVCVCVSVCLSVTTLTATYLVYDSKMRCLI